MDTVFVNRYRVLAELGQGAMGKVYKVADTLQDDRAIALKTIRVAGEITAALRLRFKEEFRIMAQLQHPNTLEVYDFGTLDDHNHYFTMEVVPGRELSELVEEGPMPLDRFYALVIQLLQALNFIHSRQYIHRDIKAQNIRVRDDGTLKLMDFGLTCQAGLPSKGQLNGTPGYMAPEMVWGGSVDAAADLYAVGCLAYEMLTGQLPFVGRVAEVLRAHRDQKPVSPRVQRPELPERLEGVVMKLLEKDPARRYRTCEPVIADLAALAGITLARENLDQRKSYLITRALVGREKEIATLDTAMAALRQGEGGAILVGAPAGVGKSRLMQEFVLHASLNETFVLQGACQEAGHGPYEAIVATLKRAVPYTLAEEWARFGPVLASLMPHLVETGLVAGAAEPLPDATKDKLRLHDAFLAWLEALAERTPLVLLMDDVQFADPQSIEVFNHCIRQRQSGRLLLVGTFRNDETPATSPVWFTHEEGLSQYVTLGPLDPEQVGQLLTEMLGAVEIPPSFSRSFYDVTGGNPFFVREVLLYLLEEGLLTYLDGVWRFPQDTMSLRALPSVASTIERRLAHLSPRALALAQVAAVIGPAMDLELLLAVSGMDEDAFFEPLEELLERQFLLKGDALYTFPHSRLRLALYDMLYEATRRSLHLRCAEHLERRARTASMSWVFELAHHYTQGLDQRLAFDYLCLAGDISYQRNADALALDYWRQAIDALGSVGWDGWADKEFHLLLKIGRNGFILSPREAIDAFERALVMLEGQLLEPEEELKTRLEVLTLLANAYGFLGAPRKGLEVVEQALMTCPPEMTEVRAAIQTVQATNLMAAGRFDEMRAIAEQAAAVLMREDLEAPMPMVLGARVGVAAFQNAVCFQGVRPDEKLAEFAYWASAQIGDELPITIRQFFGLWYAWTGRHDEAVAYIDEVSQLSRRIGAPPYHWVLYLRPYLLMQRGEHKEALALIDAAIQFPHLDQVEMTRYMISILQGQALLAHGKHRAAHMVLSAALSRGRTTGMHLITIQALIGLGEVEFSLGDRARAERFLREAYSLSGTGVAKNPLHRAIAARWLGETALLGHDVDQARIFADEALAIVTRPEQDNWIEQAHIHRLLGEIHHAQGRKDDAIKALQQAGNFYHRIKNQEALHGVIKRLEVVSAHVMPRETEVMPIEARWQFMSGMLH